MQSLNFSSLLLWDLLLNEEQILPMYSQAVSCKCLRHLECPLLTEKDFWKEEQCLKPGNPVISHNKCPKIMPEMGKNTNKRNLKIANYYLMNTAEWACSMLCLRPKPIEKELRWFTHTDLYSLTTGHEDV